VQSSQGLLFPDPGLPPIRLTWSTRALTRSSTSLTQKLYHDRADPGDAPMTLWAEPRGRGWVIIDAAGRAVEPGVVYIT
jgi:uncharacterized membrane protein